MVAMPKVGIFVSFSIILAIPLKSVPIIMGMGVPPMQINLGWRFFAASTISRTSFPSSPITASSSDNADIYTMLSMEYHLGSSWVV